MSPARRARLGLTLASSLVLGLGATWAIGFAWFTSAARMAPQSPGTADGIVVLTGGVHRIDTALHLLAEGKAPLLLVSGVAGGADLGDLARRVPLDPSQAERVTLGRAAQSTAGNAAETAPWAREHGMRRLIVVTAGYHMPRALLELRRALPEVELHPVPVQPPPLQSARPVARVRVLAAEFDKLLVARAGVGHMLRPGAL